MTPLPWVLSAHDESALRAHAQELWAHVEARPELAAADVGWSLAADRRHLGRRAVVVGDDRDELLAGLEAVAAGAPAPGVARGSAGAAGRLAFVFPGQGSQWPGMALALAAASPVFAGSLRACERALAPHVDWKLDDVLRAAPDDVVWERSDMVQPALFCAMVSLARLWAHFGVRPDAVVGHSLGEISAACVAGILSLEDAARVAALTSRGLHELGGDDGMALVDRGAGELRDLVQRVGGRLTLAAFNGPRAIVVSGEQRALDALLAACEADGIRARRIRVDGTSSVAHSSQIEAIRERLARDLAPVTPRPSGVTFYSSVTGEPLDYAELGPEYWYRSLRQPVCFEQATSALVRDGATAFVESSPHPVLTFAVEGTVEAAGGAIPVIGSLRRDGGLARMLTSLGEAHACGIAVDWAPAFADARPRRVELPHFAAEREQEAAPAAAAPAPELPVRDDSELLALVREHAAAVLGLGGPEAIAPRRAFRELGMESLQGVELRNRLAQVTGLRLPSTLVYDNPTPAAVAERLGAMLSGQGQAARAAVRASAHHDEPIAIVGIGCRYPGGVGSAEDLWELVASGTDAIGPFPTDRGWDLERLYDPDPDAPGTSYVRDGGFLYDAPEFDAAFFQIAPREAVAMDPQQRLVLETAWAALEDAAIDPDRLAGSATGVFLGISSQDYASIAPGADTRYEGLRMTGALTSVVSGRVSYALGLQGPGVTVDTACSSSLVALHLACQALRSGECSLALAGGVTVLSSPGMFTEFSRQRGLARDGRSKAFAAAADGASWAEGAGVLVVERLSDARRHGHRVLALVRGSATNQDGASNGLSAPNGPSQEQVIRQALANAGVRPGEVDAVEAHGTGTTLGDPIEAQALLATYGQERADGPLRLGSIKSNIGHSHAAAGVAGVIKMVMAMRAGVLPQTLHVDEPTPHVDWSAGEVELLTEALPWPRRDRPRRAGVSGFGISGTNAHVVLEEAPDDAPRAVAPPAALPWVLSAKTAGALRAQARRLRAHLDARPQLDPVDVGWTLAAGRARLAHRAAIAGRDRAALLAGLDAVAAGMPADGVATGVARDAAKVAFVFPGQGSQWLGMALELWDTSDVFGAQMQACADALAPHTGWELRDVVAGAPGAPALERMDVVQPASFAVFVSLAALWRSYGVRPAVVVGHSQGEIAAAHVAGALSLEDAARVAALRSAALVELAGAGGMMSVFLPADAVLARIERFGGRISLASYNSPRSTVVSGEPAALRELLEECEARGERARMIAVDYASHSVQIEAIRERLIEDLRPIAPVSAPVAIMSTTTAGLVDGADLDAEHWYRNLREPVRFEQATRALVEDGVTAFVESSPHPVLTWAVQETVDDAAPEPDRIAVAGTLRRGEGGLARFLASAGEAFVCGVDVDWEVAFAGAQPRRVGLPAYPFERTRFWLDGAAAAAAGGAQSLSAAGVGAAGHPLLGATVQLAGRDGCLLTGRVGCATHPWLADHEIAGAVTLPQSALAELALRAGAEAGCETLAELEPLAPLVVPEQGGVQLQVSVGAAGDDGRRSVEVHGRDADGGAWTLHARGTLAPAAPPAAADAGAWPPPGAEAIDVDELYDRLAASGRAYGPALQGVQAAWRRGDELLAQVALGEEQAAEAGRYLVHPALLDAALQPAIAQRAADEPLALHWRGLRVDRPGVAALRVRITSVTDGALRLTAHDERGAPVLSADAIALRAPAPGAVAPRRRAALDALYEVRWVAIPAPPAANGAAPHLVALGEAGIDGVQRIAGPAALAAAAPGPATVAVAAPADPQAALALLHDWLAEERLRDVRLAVLVPGAAAVRDGEAADPDAAAVRGLLRSAQSEHPGRFVTVDADDPGTVASALATGEQEIAVRGGELLVARLARASGDALPATTWRLAPERAGDLVGAAPDHGDGDRPLGPGEVRLAVRAAAVTERDVRVAIGVEGGPLGTHAAGVVAQVGAGVARLAAGDRVMGTAAGAFAPLAIADADELAPIPAGWTFAQAAAALPSAAGEPPPLVAFDVRDGSQALQLVARGAAGATAVVLTIPHALDPDGTVLVTGGTGGLGAVVAEHLAREHGARRLLLVSRRGAQAPGADELRERLAQLGCEATVAACDASDRGALAQLLAGIAPQHPLTAVVHAAGTLDNAMIDSLDGARLDGVMRPKADAARWLDELTRGADLAAFVLFSSVAATFSHPGQGNYAAANAYLDALAQRRRAAGLPASAVAWGLWGTGSGMSTRLSREDIEVLAADTGQRELPVEQALALLDVALAHREPLLVATTLDFGALRAQARAGVLPALLSDLVRTPARRAGAGADGSLARRLAAIASEQERQEVVLELVRAQAAAVLGHAAAADVPPDRTFKELGFDSLGSVVLRNRLAQITGLRLPSTLVFDHPTAAAMARFVRALAEDEEGAAAVDVGPAATPAELVVAPRWEQPSANGHGPPAALAALPDAAAPGRGYRGAVLSSIAGLARSARFRAWVLATRARLARLNCTFTVELDGAPRFDDLPRIVTDAVGEGGGSLTLRIGRDCRFGRELTLDVMTHEDSVLEIGDRCQFQDRIRLQPWGGAIRFGPQVRVRDGAELKSKGELIVGADSFIGRNTTVHCHERIELADHVNLAEGVSVMDSDHTHDGSDTYVARQRIVSAPVYVQSNVFVGTNALILRGSHVGRNVMIATGSVLTGGDYPERYLLAGAPAQPLRPLAPDEPVPS